MSEDRTRELPDSLPFEERVLTLFDRVFDELATIRAEVVAVRDRQDALEDKVDRRLQETRPIWEAVLQEVRATEASVRAVATDVAIVKADVRKLNAKMDVVAEQLLDHSAEIRILNARMAALEEREQV